MPGTMWKHNRVYSELTDTIMCFSGIAERIDSNLDWNYRLLRMYIFLRVRVLELSFTTWHYFQLERCFHQPCFFRWNEFLFYLKEMLSFNIMILNSCDVTFHRERRQKHADLLQQQNRLQVRCKSKSKAWEIHRLFPWALLEDLHKK